MADSTPITNETPADPNRLRIQACAAVLGVHQSWIESDIVAGAPILDPQLQVAQVVSLYGAWLAGQEQ